LEIGVQKTIDHKKAVNVFFLFSSRFIFYDFVENFLGTQVVLGEVLNTEYDAKAHFCFVLFVLAF